MEIEEHRQGQKKKNEFRDERGCKEENVGGTGEEGKRTERGRENDWIPLGSEPVQLNNGSAEQYWLGWRGGRWQYAYCCSLSGLELCRCRRHSILSKELAFQPAPWAINPTTCCSQTNCLLPFANPAPLKSKSSRGKTSRRRSEGWLQ